MKLEGSTVINAPRATAYGYLTDANFVGQCAPGVERVEARLKRLWRRDFGFSSRTLTSRASSLTFSAGLFVVSGLRMA